MKEYGADRTWPFAEGGGPTLALATLLWSGVLALWRARPSLASRLLATVATGLWLLVLYFFRDPNRRPVTGEGLVVSAGDGEVVAIEPEREEEFLKCEAVRISVFLSILDVHVQRAPISGTVTMVEHRPGKFLQAFRPEASTENEFIAMNIETANGDVLVKQIAGIMARRCVNYTRPAQQIAIGQRIGLIRFGSRVDVFLPPDAEILTTVGDHVRGGVTPMARLSGGGLR
ncbi:MAG: phosphatidylserine decarboxylase [Candidatus Promineifilaceae bacterium]|nr:phosphatidylserine decarboxylase [Candidatus Promineifilaceae bacterium]